MSKRRLNLSPHEEGNGLNGLTPIHERIHCAATADTIQSHNENELDSIAINNFLDTLAEIALAVARRRQQLDS